MESCSIQKSVEQIKIYVIFEIDQSSLPLLDNSLSHSWHSLNQIHELVTWNAFKLTFNEHMCHDKS
jgi:hypothetical protein